MSDLNEAFRAGVIAGDRYAREKDHPHECCYVEEADHPTYPSFSDHPFGDHPILAPKVGCSLCNANLNKSVKAAWLELNQADQ